MEGSPFLLCFSISGILKICDPELHKKGHVLKSPAAQWEPVS